MIFRKIHATTTYPPTYFRLGSILLLACLIVLVSPHYGERSFDFFSFNAINIGLLFAVLSGFLMMITLTRKQALMSCISLELNKIRRLHHLALNISLSDPKSVSWYKTVQNNLTAYFDLFRTKDFRSYDEGNVLFRHVTYSIYQLPQKSKTYNSELFTAILDTAGEATEAREQIRSLKDPSIGFFQWASMVIVTASFALIIAVSTPQLTEARGVSALVIFNLFLMMQLLFEYDRINPRKGKAIAQVYLENEKLMYSDLEGLTEKPASSRTRRR